MRSLFVALTILGAASASTLARGVDCSGDPGFVLTITPDQVPIGTDFQICAEGPAGWIAVLMVSLGQGPTDTDFGTLCLDFPLVAFFPFVIPKEGEVCFDHHMYCDKGLVGL